MAINPPLAHVVFGVEPGSGLGAVFLCCRSLEQNRFIPLDCTALVLIPISTSIIKYGQYFETAELSAQMGDAVALQFNHT